MKAIVVSPKDEIEFKLVTGLLEKLEITSITLSQEELANLGLSKLLQDAEKPKKNPRLRL